MFELSVASKYLTPRWRQLSVSIISTVSILVIALVVWLIIVFFSVTDGLEKGWIQKLIALTAPIRITPTEAYTHSYYYQIDTISAASEYSPKSIGSKLSTLTTDPYDPTVDEELPSQFPLADREADGSLKDIVKKTFQIASNLNFPGLRIHDYEMTISNLRLHLAHESATASTNQSFLSQAAYLGSFDKNNSEFLKALLPISMQDLKNVMEMMTMSSGNVQEDTPDHFRPLDAATVQNKLSNFFQNVTIHELKTPPQGWMLPYKLLIAPKDGNIAPQKFQVVVVNSKQGIVRVVIPQDRKSLSILQNRLINEGYTTEVGQLEVTDNEITLKLTGSDKATLLNAPVFIDGGVSFPAKLIEASLAQIRFAQDVRFEVRINLQGNELKGQVSLGTLVFQNAEIQTHYESVPSNIPSWMYVIAPPEGEMEMRLPLDPQAGDGVMLPKSFRDAGALLGDRGILSYYAPTTSSIQEQRIPIYVAGFYDPGIIPIGGKYVLANPEIVSQIRASQSQDNALLSNGISVRFDNLEQADKIKAALQDAFKRDGLDQYWRIETYREFEFTKDLIQQLGSEKNLWSLIATIIIIVACSNIISMLIILVNDKKKEIGILRSMGASAISIALIFGVCGVFMGLIGSLIGTAAAILTLKNLQSLLDFISRIQGYDVFNPVFYGNILPNEISYNALMFVIIATSLISLLAGIVPAIKASIIRPASILKSE